MTRKRTFRIGIIGDRSIKAERERISGVLRFLSDHSDLQAEFCTTNSPRVLLKRDFDGIVGRFSPSVQSNLGKRMPIVTFEENKAVCGAGLSIDNESVARQAFAHFKTRGLINFAYVATDLPDERIRSKEREAAFVAAAAEAGFACPVARSCRIEDLADWLTTLPRPCAILAYADSVARLVVDASHYAHLAIPDQIQIIGVDNDLDICENTQPGITSIWPDFYEAGRRGAELLCNFLRNGSPKRPLNEKYGVKALVERASTIDLRGGGRLVSLANDYLRQNFRERLAIDDLARRLNVSRRLLDLRYREIMGHTLHEEWDRLRLDEAKRLLTSGLSVETVCDRSGFGSTVAFRNAFRKCFDVSPSDWCAEFRLSP